MLNLIFNVANSNAGILVALIIILGIVGAILTLIYVYFSTKKKRKEKIESFVISLLQNPNVTVLNSEFLNNMLNKVGSRSKVEDLIKVNSINGEFVNNKKFFVKSIIEDKICENVVDDILKRYKKDLEKIDRSEKIFIPLKEVFSEKEIIKILET